MDRQTLDGSMKGDFMYVYEEEKGKIIDDLGEKLVSFKYRLRT